MKSIQGQVRQGDVLLIPVDAIPLDAGEASAVEDIVLAEGEATGHAHRIKVPRDRVKQYRRGLELYLKVSEPVPVEHEEHGTVTLEPGDYLARQQTEFWLDEVRQVVD